MADVSGAQSAFYASAVTTLSDIYTAGAFTFTGTTPATTTNVHQPILLGQPFVDGLQYFGVGDSILYGTGDDGSQGAFGRGFFQRAMHNNFSDPVPSCNFGRPSVGNGAFTGGNTKWLAWVPYANRAVEELLTNNISNQSVATMQSAVSGIWSTLKSNGVAKVIRTQLMARTNSTDSYATTLNQTPINADWNTGGKVDQLNAWFPSQLGSGFDAYASMENLLDMDQNFWKVNGAAYYMSQDGVHPYNNGGNGIGHSTAADALRSTRTTLS